MDMDIDKGNCIVYETDFGVRRIPYLSEHRIQGAVVVPGAAFIEMAMAAAIEIYGPKTHYLNNVEFHEALFLPEIDARKVRFLIAADKDQNKVFRVISTPEGSDFRSGEPTVHVSGEFCRIEAHLNINNGDEPIDKVLGRCEEIMCASTHLESLKSKGFDFGPSFRQTVEIRCGKSEAISKVALPDHLRPEKNLYYFHPTLLDACIQACAGALPENIKDNAYLPVGVEKFYLWAHPSERLFSHVVLRPYKSSESDTLTADINISDESGLLVAQIYGLRIQRFDRVAPCAIKERIAESFYQLEWCPSQGQQALMEGEKASPGETLWIIFGKGEGVSSVISKAMDKRDGVSVLVIPGDGFKRCSDSLYESWPGNHEHYLRLIEELKIAAHVSVNIVYCSEYPKQDFDVGGSLFQTQSVADYCLSFLSLVQVLKSLNDTRDLKLWLVTQNACNPPDNDYVDPADSALWGFAGVVAQEYQGIWAGRIDTTRKFDDQDCDLAIETLLQPVQRSQVQCAISSGSAFQPRLIHLEFDQRKLKDFHARSDQCYLITGGLGGLGLRVASWLVKRGARYLALIGRTELPCRENWAGLDKQSREYGVVASIQAMERLGATIYLPVVDIADQKQVEAMFSKLKQQAPAISGVIHAAGIVEDRALKELDYPALAEVMRPKVIGSWLLHQNSLSLDLEFFVLFSSLSSLIGTPGQGNYVAANAYMDGLAALRQRLGLPSLSINWGPWDEAGMAAQFDRDRFSRLGLRPIKPEEGCQALGILLANGVNHVQVTVADIQWDRFVQSGLSAVFGDPLQANISARANSDENRPVNTESDTVEDKSNITLGISAFTQPNDLIAYIRQRVAMVLGLDSPESIDPAEPLLNYGLESLMALRLKNDFETELKQTLPATLIFDYPTINDLAGYMANKSGLNRQADAEERIQSDDNSLILEMLEEIERLPDKSMGSHAV